MPAPALKPLRAGSPMRALAPKSAHVIGIYTDEHGKHAVLARMIDTHNFYLFTPTTITHINATKVAALTF